ncbi:hypothetical protein HYPSUDRAFT_54993 [Hypholoma sublateritium FD-334 SS-4]|uniref:Uncharacterized protein n=1 Tax=Hypholoma sublateritium (strain FD-334 SS-4) TaxID=945553 RepID=A0A0D2L607_HYPSF|nr:hypothetical protein HYPSUDRAFT_54993 [Hypholoma sublateritium FD-334 SS-4]
MSNSIFPTPTINSRPLVQFSSCHKCHSHALTALYCGGATVTVLENYGRYYQVCHNCKEILWHNAPTDPGSVPADVLNWFYYRQDIAAESRIFCQEANCGTLTGNVPRRASKQCEFVPPRCKPCCVQSGGCKEHRPNGQPGKPSTAPVIESAAAPAASVAVSPVSPSGSASMAALSTSESQSQSTQPCSSYARSLTQDYGEGWQLAQREKEARRIQLARTEEAIRNAQNTIIVIIWKQAGARPKVLNVITHEPGFLIPVNIPQIADIFQGTPLLSVFQTTPRIGWASQGLDVPIPAVRDMRVLLRYDNLDDEDCLSLGDEMEQRLSEGHARRRGEGINVFGVHAPVTPPPSNSLATTESDLTATSLSQTLQETLDAEQKALGSSRLKNGATRLIELFTEHFPKCQFVRSTFYHALNLYSRALEVEDTFGTIAQFIRYGDTPKGTWKNFRKEVDHKSFDNYVYIFTYSMHFENPGINPAGNGRVLSSSNSQPQSRAPSVLSEDQDLTPSQSSSLTDSSEPEVVPSRSLDDQVSAPTQAPGSFADEGSSYQPEFSRMA